MNAVQKSLFRFMDVAGNEGGGSAVAEPAAPAVGEPVVTEEPKEPVEEPTQPAEEPAEPEQPKEEPKEPEAPKESVEERIERLERELAESKEASRKEQERKAQEQKEQEQYLPPLNMEAVNARMAELVRQKDEAELAGDYTTALDRDDEIREFRAQVKEYEKARAAQEEKKGEAEKAEQFRIQVNKQIETALTDILTERKTSGKEIPADIVQKGRNWFEAQREANPVLNKRYTEMVLKQGPYAALEWAIDYVEKNMGQAAKADQQAKQEAKGKLPETNSGAAITVAGKEVKSWLELMDLPSKEINKFCKEHNKEFQRLKDAHFK